MIQINKNYQMLKQKRDIDENVISFKRGFPFKNKVILPLLAYLYPEAQICLTIMNWDFPQWSLSL